MSQLRPWICLAVIIACIALPAAAHNNDATGKNKQTVTAFYNLIFRDHKPAEAFARYGGDKYIQHNPNVPDGKDAVINFFTPFFQANPDARSEIKRAVAEGDLVWLHVHSKKNATDRGRAIVDIFRVEKGKVVEHWDVVQDIPEKAANTNTMF
ncbi:MAG TPA: nuclear transport factor 2 family protein [Polyangiales bacterium]|nr:nuclear transport factor 2 family protein [Polyangiales bacterium]